MHSLSGATRQTALKVIINRGLQRMQEETTKYTIAGREFVLRDQISNAANLVLWAKSLIGEAVKASPEASIAWAGVCLILPLLTNPATADEANRDGFAYVSSRMSYYTALEPLLQRLGQNTEIPIALITEANDHLVELYKHILKFQISSVLRFYYSSLRRYAEDVLQLADWKKMRHDIEKLDVTVHQNLIQMNQLVARQELELLNKTSMEHLEALQTILSVSELQLQIAKDQRGIAQKQLDVLEDAARRRLSEKEEQCLQLFRLTDSNRDATYEWYKDRIEDRVEGTCQWFLQHENFQKWVDRQSGPLLVSADPGCGKSVLAKYLVNDILLRPGVTVCYFFFKDQDQNTVRQALCALLHQLFSQKPSLIEHALRQFEKDGPGLINSRKSLWNVFEGAVGDPRAGSVIVVLDALDECNDVELENLVENLERQFCSNSLSCGNLRYLLTSRPYEQVICSLQGLSEVFPDIRIKGEGEAESDTISFEIDLVVKYRVSRMNLPPPAKHCLENRLLEIRHRTYLWVYLVFDYLKKTIFKKTGKGVEDAIATLPENVNDAYERILSKSPEPALARKALCIILAAKRPLTLSEMNTAVNIGENTQAFEDLDLEEESDFQTTLRSWCGLFITIYHGKVDFLHQTAREFLLPRPPDPFLLTLGPAPAPSERRWQHSITISDAHKALAEACLRYLNFLNNDNDPRMEEWNPSDPDEPGEGDALDDYLENLCFLRYSVSHWVAHFREACFASDAVALDLFFKVCGPSRSCSIWWRAFWESDGNPGRTRYDLIDLHTPPGCLEMASCFGLDVLVKLLLAHGADARGQEPRTQATPLQFAASYGHENVVSLLLEHGADVKTSDSRFSTTPLLMAASAGRTGVVRLLLAHDADVGAKDEHDGMTALHLAAGADMAAHHLGLAVEADSTQIAGLLLAHGADVGAKDWHGRTPLHLAAEADSTEIVGLLLAHHADVEAKDSDLRLGLVKWTPLHYAVGYGFENNQDIARLLLAHNANVEVKDENGRTPLHWAAIRGQVGMVGLLLEHGANVEAKDEDGRTPLWFVTADGGGDSSRSEVNDAIADLLLAHGAVKQ